jgi:hypothetical protein
MKLSYSTPVDQARNVDIVISERPRCRLADVRERGEMNDSDRPMLLEGDIERGSVEDVAFNEWAPAHEFGVPSRQVVKRRSPTRRGKRLAGVAADEAGAAGEQDGLHADELSLDQKKTP